MSSAAEIPCLEEARARHEKYKALHKHAVMYHEQIANMIQTSNDLFRIAREVIEPDSTACKALDTAYQYVQSINEEKRKHNDCFQKRVVDEISNTIAKSVTHIQSVEHIIDGFLKDKGSMEDHAFDVLNLELEIASYQILSDGEISDALTSAIREDFRYSQALAQKSPPEIILQPAATTTKPQPSNQKWAWRESIMHAKKVSPMMRAELQKDMAMSQAIANGSEGEQRKERPPMTKTSSSKIPKIEKLSLTEISDKSKNAGRSGSKTSRKKEKGSKKEKRRSRGNVTLSCDDVNDVSPSSSQSSSARNSDLRCEDTDADTSANETGSPAFGQVTIKPDLFTEGNGDSRKEVHIPPSPLPSSVEAPPSPTPLPPGSTAPSPLSTEPNKEADTAAVSTTTTRNNLEKALPCVAAICDYTSADHSELTLGKGDILYLLDEEDSDWWIGVLRGKVGFFPSSHVIRTSDVESDPPPFLPPLPTHKVGDEGGTRTPPQRPLRRGDTAGAIGQGRGNLWRGRGGPGMRGGPGRGRGAPPMRNVQTTAPGTQ